MRPTKGKAPAPTKTQGASPNPTGTGDDYPLILVSMQEQIDSRMLAGHFNLRLKLIGDCDGER